MIHVWALALLLLLFQSVTLAHSHDDLAHALESCEICVHAQQTDDLAIPAPLPVQARSAAPVAAVLYRTPLIAGANCSYSPRAPPAYL